VTATLAPRVEHRFHPRGACAEAFRARDPELLVSGPAGTGKSRALLEKLHYCALANPGMRGLIVRKTAVSMTSTALVTWREFVITEAERTGLVRYYGGSQAEPPQYRYRNGSRIMLGGMDRPTKIMSSEYDLIYVQEAIELTEEDWDHLSTRLRHGLMSFQQLMADTNPDTDIHWLNQRCNRGSTRRLESRHADNPILVDDNGERTERGKVYLDRLDKLTGVRRARLRDGLWQAAEGAIYEEVWDPARNLIDPFAIPVDWTRWWAVDFGFIHPFVLQCWAEDPDGRLFLYREIYRTRRLVEDHARDIMAIVAPGEWVEPKPRAIVCDHDAEDRATLERHLGRSTATAHKDVSPGIQAVATRMRPEDDGRPRLVLMRDAVVHVDQWQAEAKLPTCTAEEVPGYVWADSKTKEQPLKENDDGCDAMRYMVAQRDLVGRPRVRFM
jgi:hypothetical protein